MNKLKQNQMIHEKEKAFYEFMLKKENLNYLGIEQNFIKLVNSIS